MQGELSRLYYEYYRFAFDVARRAEQTMKRDLMRPELDSQTLVKFNYWDGGRKGLLSGEALYLGVKRMEMAYHEHNLREYELTKHVSLLQVDPLALISLCATGRCTVRLPEALFDLDGPGHDFRRIKTASLTLRHRPLRRRQLQADPAQEQYPQVGALERRLRPRRIGRHPLPGLFR